MHSNGSNHLNILQAPDQSINGSLQASYCLALAACVERPPHHNRACDLGGHTSTMLLPKMHISHWWGYRAVHLFRADELLSARRADERLSARRADERLSARQREHVDFAVFTGKNLVGALRRAVLGEGRERILKLGGERLERAADTRGSGRCEE
eukprot:scaffold82734_cov26-Tisochrysis_lutea.AAC.4